MFLGVTIKEWKSLLTSVVDDGTLEYYKTALAAHLARKIIFITTVAFFTLLSRHEIDALQCKKDSFFCGKKTEDISTVDFTYNDNDCNNCFYLQIDL